MKRQCLKYLTQEQGIDRTWIYELKLSSQDNVSKLVVARNIEEMVENIPVNNIWMKKWAIKGIFLLCKKIELADQRSFYAKFVITKEDLRSELSELPVLLCV